VLAEPAPLADGVHDLAQDLLVGDLVGAPAGEPRDVLAAAKVLATMEAEDASNTIAEMKRDIEAFMQAVKASVPEEYWEQVYLKFLELVSDSPT